MFAALLLTAVLAQPPAPARRDTTPPQGELVRLTRAQMGTLVEISVFVPDADGGPSARMRQARQQGVERDIEDAFLEIERIEHLMSEWQPESELSGVNAKALRGAVPVGPDLQGVLGSALALCKETGGAFDPTWAALRGVWRFEPGSPLPSAAALRAATARIGCGAVRLRRGRVRFDQPRSLGLGGIAKGYAVDRAVALLRRRGYANVLVSAGGDLTARGQRGGRPWRVGIQHPRRPRGELLATVDVQDGTVVTSGDYERGFVRENKRYHHIIDPKTGRPARGCMSVTVLAQRAMDADALATAAFVLGPRDGLALLERRAGVEGLIVDARGQLRLTTGARARFDLLNPEVRP